MLLEIARMTYRDDQRNHPGRAFEQWLIASKVIVNWDDGNPSILISEIARDLDVPRTNITRGVEALTERGMIRKADAGDGYTIDLNYFATRVEADYFVAIRHAVFRAGDDLRELIKTMPPAP
jgi:DNA-binding IclR family transcriptional regulator